MPKVKREMSSLESCNGPRRKPVNIWSPEEDAALLEARASGTSFKDIAAQLSGHDDVACKNRWHALQRKVGEWSEEEEAALEDGLRECEARRRDYWRAVAAFVPGRSWQQVERKAEERGRK
ncbi:hypothetical protein BC937DRAFT_87384 [Endogone sp. FLAS-F59071]|nr:hypothetical protein BC937DRAFT_87384 [Endogone sp. FLAS-F59071]|eukprot:RUS12627.1 hypothetical protein BC937DRAFT_87384 [Endogone sp. FLAS-F59071]